jgi:hypothetical protein
MMDFNKLKIILLQIQIKSIFKDLFFIKYYGLTENVLIGSIRRDFSHKDYDPDNNFKI